MIFIYDRNSRQVVMKLSCLADPETPAPCPAAEATRRLTLEIRQNHLLGALSLPSFQIAREEQYQWERTTVLMGGTNRETRDVLWTLDCNHLPIR